MPITLGPSYLAGLLDRCMSIKIKDGTKVNGLISGPELVLSIIQRDIGGKVYGPRKPYLVLNTTQMIEISRYLVSTPCGWQAAYQAILDYQDFKGTFAPNDLDGYRSRAQAVLSPLRRPRASPNLNAYDESYRQGYRQTDSQQVSTIPLVYGDSIELVKSRQVDEQRQKKELQLAIRAAKKQETIKRREAKRGERQQFRQIQAVERRKIVEARHQEVENQKAAKRQIKVERRVMELDLIKQNQAYCRKCERVLPLDRFNRGSHTHTGYSLYCKTCCKEDHYLPNRTKLIAGTKAWMKSHPREVRIHRKRTAAKPYNKIRRNMSHRIKKYIESSSSIWREAISCTPKQLVTHLESQFDPSMSWANYGTHWHIDHIVPCAAFDPSKANHLKWCWHHKNLRPLIGTENVDKGDLLSNGERASVLRTQNIARLKEVVGAELEKLSITTAANYSASWDGLVPVIYLVA